MRFLGAGGDKSLQHECIWVVCPHLCSRSSFPKFPRAVRRYEAFSPLSPAQGDGHLLLRQSVPLVPGGLHAGFTPPVPAVLCETANSLKPLGGFPMWC